jgi:hypothetical protein
MAHSKATIVKIILMALIAWKHAIIALPMTLES